mmetsp:Transcript_7693/g.15566  ORF Transcript_7693/g.15566 Transcript_7693/m.15566 type:complete len:92 (-) Transcript_7693:545-820(-)
MPMMVVMEVSPTIEWEPTIDAPREVVSAVALYRLESTREEVPYQREEMRLKKQWSGHCGGPQDESFRRMRVLRGDSKRGRMQVMNTMNVFV